MSAPNSSESDPSKPPKRAVDPSAWLDDFDAPPSDGELKLPPLPPGSPSWPDLPLTPTPKPPFKPPTVADLILPSLPMPGDLKPPSLPRLKPSSHAELPRLPPMADEPFHLPQPNLKSPSKSEPPAQPAPELPPFTVPLRKPPSRTETEPPKTEPLPPPPPPHAPPKTEPLQPLTEPLPMREPQTEPLNAPTIAAPVAPLPTFEDNPYGFRIERDDYAGLDRLSKSLSPRPRPAPPVETPPQPAPAPPAAAPRPALLEPVNTPASLAELRMLLGDSGGPEVEPFPQPVLSAGQSVTYGTIVHNSNGEPMEQVRVEHELPAEARFVFADPPAQLSGRRLVWVLGALEPGAQRHFEVTVRPTRTGEIPDDAIGLFQVYQCVTNRARLRPPDPAATSDVAEKDIVDEPVPVRIEAGNDGADTIADLGVNISPPDEPTHPDGPVPPPLRTAAAEPPQLALNGPLPEPPLDVPDAPHLTFTLAGIDCAVAISSIVEVVRLPNVTPLPNSPGWLLGMGAVRGDIVPLIDLRAFLGLPGAPVCSGSRILLARLRDGESATGLVVDRVADVCSAHPAQDGADILNGPERVRKFVAGVGERGGRLLLFLDLDRLLNSPELHPVDPPSSR